MDRNLDIDNFERLLKDRSDEFKMYPTKRVWYSIYNNIHPGRKWPSIAMSITLIAILLLVGYLNTDNTNINLAVQNPVQVKDAVLANLPIQFSNPFLNNSSINNQIPLTQFANNSTLTNLDNIKSNRIIKSFKLSPNNSFINVNKDNNEHKNVVAFSNTKSSNKYEVITILPITNNELKTIIPIRNELIVATLNNKISDFVNRKNTFIKRDDLNIQNNKSGVTGEIQDNDLLILADLNDSKTNASNNQNTISISDKKDIIIQESNLSNAEKGWIENYALYNRPAPRKWVGKLGWQTYVTPSVVYRILKNTMPSEGDINNSVKQHPSIGLEIGRGLIYSVSNSVKLKTGLQLNFTRYNAEAYENSHPVASIITLHSSTGEAYPAYRSTPFSNNDGITPTNLHNETFQISIPIGMDLKLAGNETLQWNIGATIQPSYVFGGKSYLISSDKRNYIKETSLLNRWNLNAGFETFISYKINSFTFQLGPQFRKQLFTTNTKQYSVQEKLTNYGFKIGITKLIK